MLQIASGRFFETTDLYEHAGTGVLYSNFSWVREIVTSAATLIPADTTSGSSPTSWVVHYVNRMEKIERAGALVRVGDAELIEQIQLLCILGLGAFFHVDRDVVAHGCRPRSVGQHDHNPPAMFVTRLLQPSVPGTVVDEAHLQKFIDDAIHLPRAKYKAVVACARALCDSLVVASYNIHLAYSMLVYALESLSQQFDAFEPTWDHFEQGFRNQLESALDGASDSVSEAVKEVLTSTQHNKLMARFVEFVTKHVTDEYYRGESPATGALRASDLTRALQTAYATRSGFVHKLEPIRAQICVPQIASGEIFEWDQRPHFTYRGLVRLLRHVLTTFVEQGERLESEPYPWRGEIPGVVVLNLAPQYWIWKADDFSSAKAPSVLSGFLTHFNEVRTNSSAFTDMRAVLAKCVELLPGAKAREKRAMLLLIALFNLAVREEDRVPRWNDHFEKHANALENCCVERLILDLLLDQEWTWSAADCAACVEEYGKKRHHKDTLQIPRIQQRALVLGVYNKMITEGLTDTATIWARRALLDEAGAPDLQSMIESTAAKFERFDLKAMMWGHDPEQKRDT